MFRERRPQKAPPFDWGLWMRWILATTLGWVAGWAISEFAVGLIVGLGQWVVLRKRLAHAEWWVLASGISWAAARGLAEAVFAPQSVVLIGGTLGLALGLAQWLFLREHVVQAWWWIVVNTLSWAVGLTGFLGASLVGAVVGAVTGLALEPMLRYSAPPLDDEVD